MYVPVAIWSVSQQWEWPCRAWGHPATPGWGRTGTHTGLLGAGACLRLLLPSGWPLTSKHPMQGSPLSIIMQKGAFLWNIFRRRLRFCESEFPPPPFFFLYLYCDKENSEPWLMCNNNHIIISSYFELKSGKPKSQITKLITIQTKSANTIYGLRYWLWQQKRHK